MLAIIIDLNNSFHLSALIGLILIYGFCAFAFGVDVNKPSSEINIFTSFPVFIISACTTACLLIGLLCSVSECVIRNWDTSYSSAKVPVKIEVETNSEPKTNSE